MALFSVMLASCFLFPDSIPEEPGVVIFYAQDTIKNIFYEVKAEMLCEGAKCVIWAEKGSGVTRATAQNIAHEYDTKIRPHIVDAFSYSLNGTENHFDDMLDYADWLTDRDGKLTILLLDIRDGFKDPKKDSYVAGYFDPGNFYSTNDHRYSNGRDMIYVDTYPGLRDQPTQAYATFAHELQHLVNFVTCVWLDKDDTDLWVNEGLSAYAEYLYLDGNPEDKCRWLKDDRNTIKTGNNFFVWGNHNDEPLAILDDYATVYLFFRWLYLQADTELRSRIFREISYSSHSDYHAVTDVAKEINDDWDDWGTLLRTWLAANYFPKESYGYTGDEELRETIRVDPIAVAGNVIPLCPGEGVYSIINNPYSAASAGNIRYAGLAAGTGAINTSSPYSGDILLTFNVNTDNSLSTASEDGSLTGVPPPPTASQTAVERQAGKWDRPYVIDARDLLGRDKPNRLPR